MILWGLLLSPFIKHGLVPNERSETALLERSFPTVPTPIPSEFDGAGILPEISILQKAQFTAII